MAWGQQKPEHPYPQQEWCGREESAFPAERVYACNPQGDRVEGVPVAVFMGAYG